jgi:hypothetical protein
MNAFVVGTASDSRPIPRSAEIRILQTIVLALCIFFNLFDEIALDNSGVKSRPETTFTFLKESISSEIIRSQLTLHNAITR